MSQILESSQTVVDQIPIGRRVHEIMKEKGAAFSQQAVAQRLGYSAETLRLMINGKREIYSFELDKLSRILKESTARITQTDIVDETNELQKLLKSLDFPEKALEIALRVLKVAIGTTEKCRALHNVGVAYFYMQQFDDAYQALLEAHSLARILNEKYGESDRLYRVLLNVVDTYTAKKQYMKAIEIIKDVEHIFYTSPQRTSALNYIHAEMSKSLGDHRGAKEYSYKSLDFARITGKQNLIGRAQINAAHYEYVLKEYENSKGLLLQAIQNLEGDCRTKYLAIKELVKTLIKLDDLTTARQYVLSNVHGVDENGFTDLSGKYWILLSRITNDPQFATNVLGQDRYSNKIKILAGRCLSDLYKKNNDSQKFMHYHVITEELAGSSSDILDEEGM